MIKNKVINESNNNAEGIKAKSKKQYSKLTNNTGKKGSKKLKENLIRWLNENWDKCHKFYEKGVFEKVISHLEKLEDSIACLAKIDYPTAEKYINLISLKCMCLSALGKKDEEISLLKNTLNLFPDSWELMHNLAVSYLSICEYNEALNLLKKSITKNPDNPLIYFNLANTYYGMGYLEDAINSIKIAKRLNKIEHDEMFEKEIELYLAYYYDCAGMRCEAIEVTKEYLRKYPSDIDARFNLATYYAESGMKEDALKIFNSLVPECPDDPYLLNNIAGVYSEMGMKKEARELLLKAQQLAPENKDIQDNLDTLDDPDSTGSSLLFISILGTILRRHKKY